jgi:hypothetical protein
MWLSCTPHLFELNKMTRRSPASCGKKIATTIFLSTLFKTSEKIGKPDTDLNGGFGEGFANTPSEPTSWQFIKCV